MGREKPASKYANEKVKYDGYTFDSRKECQRYKDLCLMQEAGEIEQLEVQPKFPLKVDGRDVKIRSERYPNGRRVSYYADFSYILVKGKRRVIEDVKGAKAIDTPISRLKRAVVEAQYGVLVDVVR